MKKMILTLCSLLMSSQVFAVTQIEAKKLVCDELQKQQFYVDGGCPDALQFKKENSKEMTFTALDTSGNCQAKVILLKRNLLVQAHISCD